MSSRKALAGLLLLCAAVCLIGQAAPVPQPSGGQPKTQQELEKAAAYGDAEANYQLGLLEQREGRPAALTWFREAARRGHTRAQYELGRMYFERSEVRNLPLARKWLTRAAEHGEAQAWLVLGRVYGEGGTGVPQDIAFARECYQRADAKGNREVWYSLGRMYQNGIGGVVADWPKALEYCLKAAKQGHREAQYQVGQFCQYGIGTDIDLANAVHWFEEAARQEHAYAEEKLGWLYEHGVGVEKDREKALALYKRCEKHGGYAYSHLWRLGDPGARKRYPPVPPTPVTKDVEITLEAEKAEYDLDELIVIAIHYRNVGKETYSFTESHIGGFHCPFSVKDECGKEVPNPFAERGGFHSCSGIISGHVLEPGETLVLKETLNQCVHFPKPGTYTINRGEVLTRGKDPWKASEKERREVHVEPIRLTIRAGDNGKRTRDIETLVRAYREKQGFPFGMTPPAERFPGQLDVIRRLVFYSEPTLQPFFLDALEDDEVQSFAETGLQALPDQAAVLKAFEDRLDHPEKYNTLELLYPYLRLAGLKEFDIFGEPDRLDNWKREAEIIDRCHEKAMRLLRDDKTYQHARLVPGLLGGCDDLFLIEYLIRSKPSIDLVRKCAGAIQRVNLGIEHIPFLDSLLDVPHETRISDAAIVQLVRLDRARYLPRLKSDPKKFSPEIVKFFLEPVED